MTDLLSSPIRRVSSPEKGPNRPVALAAGLAAAWVAGVQIVVCIVTAVAAWFAADTGSFADSVRVGVMAWLVGNGGGLHASGVFVAMVPLGFVALAGWLLYRGGRWAGAHAAVRSLGDVGVGAGVLAGAYALAALVALLATRSTDVRADLLRTVVATLLLAALAGGLGLLRGAGRGGEVWALLPDELRSALSGGLAAALAMLLAGGLLVAASLVVHFGSALRVAESLQAGVVGGLVLALVGAAVAPNALVFAGAFIAGPGFAVGTGTAVAPDGVRLGSLPAFPLLAALPREGAGSWWQLSLIAIPVVAGVVAGAVAVRRFPVFGLDHAALRGALAGLAGAGAFSLLARLSAGAVGPGRMQDIGPDAPAVLLVCAVAFVLGGAVAGVLVRWVTRYRERRRPPLV